MINEEFASFLLGLAPTPFLLHFTTEQNWAKIQQEGLVPQKNRMKNYYKIPLPDQVIWFMREPVEVYVNKDKFPFVIALPINYEKFGFQETIPNAEYITDKLIPQEEFLGVFDFIKYQEGHLQEKAFVDWLKKMEYKSSLKYKNKIFNPEINTDRILSIISDQWLTNMDIGNILGIDNALDEKFLEIKLKGLNRDEIITYQFYNERIYWKKNNSESSYELEISFSQALLDEDPFNPEIWYSLGKEYLEYDYFEGDMGPGNTEINNLIKNCFKNALRFVDQVIDFKFYCEIKLYLAITYDFLGKFDKALAQFDDLIERKDELEEDFIGSMYMEIAQIYTSRKEYDKAFNYAVKSERINPSDPTIGLVLRDIKKFQKSAINNEVEFIELPNTSQLSSNNQELDEINTQSINHLVLRELKKITESSEKRNIILRKSYVEQSIKPIIENPSNKKFKKIEKLVINYKEWWPDDMWDNFIKEFRLAIEKYRELQPSVWKKWGKIFLKLLTILSI